MGHHRLLQFYSRVSLLSPWAVNMWLFAVFSYVFSMSVFLSEASFELGTPDLYFGISILMTFIYTLEKAMAPDSSTLAWKIPWTQEPGRLQSMGSLGVGHD